MRERLRVAVRGAVQGVGFRPFVYRLARELKLDGFVLNGPHGVVIECEGRRAALEIALARLDRDRPPLAVIQSLESTWLDPAGHVEFEIRESSGEGAPTALVLPDIATCDDCRREVVDPANRRYRYPFTNCTNCGPRFSIIHALPYDRGNTSMRRFQMCPACQAEYDDPADRRFHAQPNACSACGPQLALWDGAGRELASRDDALDRAAAAVRDGWIVAVKGLGGFHLMVDAANDEAVRRLRHRKHREEKPFALMYPRFAEVTRHAQVSALEARLLQSPEAPIVLLRRREAAAASLAASVAPDNPYLGVMLPYTPLHVLLLATIRGPVVATSGNLADEPICTDEHEAADRLRGIADAFLVHDRPIVRPIDDSIVRVLAGREQVVRRARGYAPLPIPLRAPAPPMVAVGAHLKNTVAVTAGANVFISQHLGDLGSRESNGAFRAALASLEALYRVAPEGVVADLHPDYLSTKHAQSLKLPVFQVQHHYAHVAACMAENDLDGPALGVAWDGTGFGPDGTVWGGEFLAVDDRSFTRLGCLRPFRLPGGERAVREPRRSALGLLYAMAGLDLDLEDDAMSTAAVRAFEPGERRLLLQALAHGVNAPVTTSAGRLFDAMAAIVGLRQISSFEGQAAMALEFAADESVTDSYPFAIDERVERFALGSWAAPAVVVDWAPLIHALLADVRAKEAVAVMAARCHGALAEAIVDMALYAGQPRVVLTGGCFQNRWLLERTVSRLRDAGFRPYWHQRVPANDGGIALGQIAAYLRGVGPCVSRFPDESSASTATTLSCAPAGSISPAWSSTSI